MRMTVVLLAMLAGIQPVRAADVLEAIEISRSQADVWALAGPWCVVVLRLAVLS